jgi:hypothetical protein
LAGAHCQQCRPAKEEIGNSSTALHAEAGLQPGVIMTRLEPTLVGGGTQRWPNHRLHSPAKCVILAVVMDIEVWLGSRNWQLQIDLGYVLCIGD